MRKRLFLSAARAAVRLTLPLMLVAAFAVAASAEPFETIINNGSSGNRVDIAVLGDGYTAAEIDKYRSDVQQFMLAVFLQEPYKEYKNYFNVHRVDVVSSQSGADHPERTPPVSVNTAFDARYNCGGIQRLICVDTSKVNTVLSNTLQFNQRDIVIVIVNDSEYGGSGGSIAVASTNQSAVELILHETGHSFANLADEYGDSQGTSCGASGEPFAANATKVTDRASIKWNHWIDPSTPIPTFSFTPAVPGLYEGAVYCDTGAYRPTYNSKMRSLGTPFEQINTEQHVKRIYNQVSPIDDSSPAGAQVNLTQGASQMFSVTTTAPLTHALEVTWFVDNQAAGTGPSFNLNTAALSVGTHNVTASVSDTTSMVRKDLENVLKETRSWSVNVSQAAAVVQFSTSTAGVAEDAGSVTLTVTRTGDTVPAVTVNYVTTGGTANERGDYTTAAGTVRLASGETSKTFTVFITDDVYAEPTENFQITLSGPTGATLGGLINIQVNITDNDPTNGANPVKSESFVPAFFVRQHYVDFLNREPDAGGLSFWVGQTTGCGNADLLVCRINVSAAFFLSPEFQETGYYSIRAHRVAFGRRSDVEATRMNYIAFIRDARQLGEGFVDGQPGSGAVLEANKQAYGEQMVTSSEFITRFPTSQTAAQFVAALYASAGVTPTGGETQAAVDAFNTAGGGTAGRVAAFRKVVDSSSVRDAEFRGAFVLMQYFGYLRRDPDQSGYAFWLNKLNEFNGNYIHAEMVKAFIIDGEYKERFGPQ